MQLYTKILIGMVVGVILGLLIGPNSSLLPQDSVHLASNVEVFDAPTGNPNASLSGFKTGSIVAERDGWVEVRFEFSSADLMRLKTSGIELVTEASTPLAPGDTLTGWVKDTQPEVRRYAGIGETIVNATEWIGPYNDLALGLHKAAKYYYTPGWQEPSVLFELDINIKAWETLPADLKAIVRAAARDVNGDMLDDYNAKNMEALEQLKADGVEVRRLPDEVLARLKEVAGEVVEASAAADPAAAKVWEHQKAYLQRLYDYAEVADKDIYNIRG